MNENSIFSDRLLALAREWIEITEEMFVVIRYSRSAGSKDYFFFNSFPAYQATIRCLPAEAEVILFRERQLRYRGIADENFRMVIKSHWRAGEEWFAAELVYNEALNMDLWWKDASEIDVTFEDFAGMLVAAGPIPDWIADDHEGMQSGLVPGPGGNLVRGSY
jgi:hypothetical protein